MSQATTAHIHLDERGRAWIDDTNTKVIEVVLDQRAYGWSPEEIHFQHAHLAMAQIHAALSYHYGHQAEFDTEMARQLQEYDIRRAQVEDSPIRKRLRRWANSCERGAVYGCPCTQCGHQWTALTRCGCADLPRRWDKRTL
jgi:uncharacterized protein (DUF433 family)